MALRDTPYSREHQASIASGMERGKMPQTLPGLLRWYCVALAEELPDKIHRNELWRDNVTKEERQQGIYPVGGSHLGTLAWNHLFRVMLEESASETDPDGYYCFPVRAALSRMARRKPLTARVLCRVGLTEGDWQSVADSLGYAHEFAEGFIRDALGSLWRDTIDRVKVLA